MPGRFTSSDGSTNFVDQPVPHTFGGLEVLKAHGCSMKPTRSRIPGRGGERIDHTVKFEPDDSVVGGANDAQRYDRNRPHDYGYL
jgi:hypothetical protein